MKKIIAGTSAIALSLSMTSVALAASESDTINLEVEVVDTLSMDCYDDDGGSGDTTVALDDATTGAGLVTAGVPSVGSSSCEVTTNDDQGYYLTIEKTTEAVTWADAGGIGTGTTTGSTVMTHEDPNIDGTWYDIPDLTAYDYTANAGAGNAAAWVDGTTVGFGFGVMAEPDATEANNTLGDNWDPGATPCQDGTTGGDTAEYAGVPETAEPITAVAEYASGVTTTQVCYKVDVAATQQSGQYGGQVTFTATSDASSHPGGTFIQ